MLVPGDDFQDLFIPVQEWQLTLEQRSTPQGSQILQHYLSWQENVESGTTMVVVGRGYCGMGSGPQNR